MGYKPHYTSPLHIDNNPYIYICTIRGAEIVPQKLRVAAPCHALATLRSGVRDLDLSAPRSSAGQPGRFGSLGFQALNGMFIGNSYRKIIYTSLSLYIYIYVYIYVYGDSVGI